MSKLVRTRTRPRTAAWMLVASLVAASLATLSAPVAQAADARGNVVIPLFADSPCKDVVFVGVRGSAETGTDDSFGSGKRVRAVQDRLTQALTNTTVGVWSIDYPARSVDLLKVGKWGSNIPLYFLGVDEGVNKTKAFLRQRSQKCGTERYVLAGYSQGAMVLHRTLIDMAKNPDAVAQGVLRRIDAVVAVADPDRVASDDIVTWGTTSKGAFDYGVSKYSLENNNLFAEGLVVWGYKLTYAKMSSFGYGLSSKWIQVCDSLDSVCDKPALQNKRNAATTSWAKALIDDEGNLIHGTHYTYSHAGLTRAAQLAAAKYDRLTPKYHTLMGGRVGEFFVGEVYAEGGSYPYRISVAGAIPPGLSVSRYGTISGTPTMSGTYTITYSVTDAFGQKASGSAVIRVTGFAAAVSIDSGGGQSCAVTRAGGVRCWGPNYDGELGNGTTTGSLVPVDVVGLGAGVSAVSAGNGGTCAVTSAGAVKCWGVNAYGTLGDGGGGWGTFSSVPVAVVGLGSGAVAVSVGHQHTCALTAAGAVKCWGDDAHGELGDGAAMISSVAPVGSSVPVDVVGLGSGVTAVSAGASHSCALTSAGAVKCWGWNSHGELGNGTTTESAVPVEVVGLGSGALAVTAGAGMSTCAVVSTGGVRCWGYNNEGQLGNGTRTDSAVPVDVVGLGSEAVAVSALGAHSCALTSAGAVKCWGLNSSGELGNGTTTDSSVPVGVVGLGSGAVAVSAGGSHDCALTSTGAVRCWGGNWNGSLGDGTTTSSTTPVGVFGLH